MKVKISEILKIDLQEDIKNVIDLEDRSDREIQQEIESYIVTDGLGDYLDTFINKFVSNISETGVWISGFYGSGKSYFGKMLGYIIANPLINGTPARDRFLLRLKGVANEALLENSIRKLASINSRVVLLDVAKQNTERGLAFTLFSNLLKNLGFRDDIYGYMEFDLYLDGKLQEFKNIVSKLEGEEWDELKTSNRKVAKVMRAAYYEMGYTESEYTETFGIYSEAINSFSAGKLKDELAKYLKFELDETLVFIFDEASEAITQNKFSLLDLEGVSEALSSLPRKVWTIAIAQEKLDDVINNANVSKSQLTKVTDRFKTKIHLESTEVDIIIRNRLLQKKDEGFSMLSEFYNSNEGLVANATNLKSSFPTKTTSAEEFAVYYPFHRYQFDILQNFLFSSKALAATQIAARGMIITTFDVLRKQMRDKDLYAFTSGYAICTEAQTAPPPPLVNKYDRARKILRNNNFELDGEKLLKTIHLLSESEVVSPTPENITKSYINDITAYYDVKPQIDKALSLLVESKVLLTTNNNYKITSDLEGRLLEEMNEFNIEFFAKKRALINYIKEYGIFNAIAIFNDASSTYKFSVVSDQNDVLTRVSGNQKLKITVYSLFNISNNRQDFIEQIKMETQYDKSLITLIPDNRDFTVIDKLIADISRYSYMEEKYSNESDSEKRRIIRDFGIIREGKEKELRTKIVKAYHNASLIYMFDEILLNPDSFKANFIETQRKVIKNLYTKRLSAQLSETLVQKIFKEKKENIAKLFSGKDFSFFDNKGNFTGDSLKVIEEIRAKTDTQYIDGKTLETDLSAPPWGYSFGTIVTTLAVMLRDSSLSVKHNSNIWFSHEPKEVQEIFTNATKFKAASFKSITVILSAAEKSKAVDFLLQIDAESYIGRKVDWSMNDFDLADAIVAAAEHFIASVSSLNDTVDNFNSLFPNIEEQKNILLEFTGKVTESNYIEKVKNFNSSADNFISAVQTILKAQKFIKKNFSKVKEYKSFIESVIAELKKADLQNLDIQKAYEEFINLYKTDMVKNFGQMRQYAQIVKDAYFSLIKNAAFKMANEYQQLSDKVEIVIKDLKKNYPDVPNTRNLQKLEALQKYCNARIISEPVLEFSVTCSNCGYSLSDIINYTELLPTKESDLLVIQSNFVFEDESSMDTEEEVDTSKTPRKVRLAISQKTMTVGEYKKLLTRQLQSLTGLTDSDEVELEIE